MVGDYCRGNLSRLLGALAVAVDPDMGNSPFDDQEDVLGHDVGVGAWDVLTRRSNGNG